MAYKNKKFNDRLFRWIGIPVTGLVAYCLSVYLVPSFRNAEDYPLTPLYFILFSASLWYGNIQINYLLKDQIKKFKRIITKILLRYVLTIFSTFSISFILLIIWNRLVEHNAYLYSDLFIVQLILTLISILIGSIYETFYYYKEKETSLLTVERSEKQKIQSQLDVLKSQLDPHFIFNSLNTLSYLISTDPVKARLFNDTLAKVYRYILIHKEKDMVQLKEEIEFATNNYYLLRIRYQEGLKMQIEMDNIITENYLVPPLSLQTLIENAIKHNHFSEKRPLTIHVRITEKDIRVTNNKSMKKFEISSSKIGLLNLNERYKLIANKSITIEENTEHFSVLLPIINC